MDKHEKRLYLAIKEVIRDSKHKSPKCIYSLDEIIKLLAKRCQDKWDKEYAEDVAEKLKELEGLK